MANGLVVKNNLSALNTLNVMNSNNASMNKSQKKVSSGMKINGAADDASGYQISERMRVQVRSLDQANANTQAGNSLLKTAEGAVSSTVEILKTLKEKVLSAANGTLNESDMNAIQQEVDQSIDQINDNANATYNGKYLINGAMRGAVKDTKNVFVNQEINAAGTTALNALTDKDGKSLGIVSGDVATVSWTVGGVTTSATLQIKGSTKLTDLFAKMAGGGAAAYNQTTIGTDANGLKLNTSNGAAVTTVTAAGNGVARQIAGFSINITDAQGNNKKQANSKLDAFSEKIGAADVNGVSDALVLQTGTKSNQTINVSFNDMGAQALGLQGAPVAGEKPRNIVITTQAQAATAINVLDSAVERALSEQTKIGAIQSRLEYTSQNLTTASENVTNAESTIRDADMAKEMTEYTKYNILKQASQAMLAQANQSGQGVLSLLQ